MPASSRRDFLGHAFKVGLALALAAGPALAQEDTIQLQRAELVLRGDAYYLLGGYRLKLTSSMEEALHRGVPLHFVQLFEADRPRDFWVSEEIADKRRVLRLSHNALLRNYQITMGGNVRTFDTFSEALDVLGSLDDWQVFDRRAVQQRNLYQARTRMYLDTSMLPKPLQINAFTSNRWDLDSDWREWSFKP
jgi:hypothetical protein